MTYKELKKRHIADHSSLYDRVKIQLGPNRSARSTGERVQALQKGSSDPQLMSQLFQFGRYLIIASSRFGVYALSPAWFVDQRTGLQSTIVLIISMLIFQMNYWPAEVGNLSELHRPFFSFLDRLRPNGRIVAKKLYNARGFVVHHNIDGSLETGPFGKAEWAFWPMGHVWTCQKSLGKLSIQSGSSLP